MAAPQTAEPTPPTEWAMRRAMAAYLTTGSPIEHFAAALVAVRREAIEECAAAVADFDFVADTDDRTAGDAIRALLDKAPS